MLNEITAISGNIKKVSESGIPAHTPMLFFASDGGGTGISTANWRRPLSNYISKISNGKIIFLNCGHYVQDYESTEISEKSQSFIDSLSNK
ncbi:hypothetical protein [Clostridium ljungdahlii]|uniref:Uncharacterized protein n=1 Tax=Clostridium ljungdahlii TaxID=1538 RepID=A0A168MKZ3_9CLOT|nr:hypothetical protein [Clostridium ljungdahlii]OAA84837.1 hypothetical protein WY13_02740 [Clostridium ljungdahlii]